MKIRMLGFMLFAAAAAAVAAQSAPTAGVAPAATVVRAADIEAAVRHANTGAFSDSVLRVLPADAGYNVGVSIVRRSQVNGATQADAIVHDAVTEVYQIIEGNGVLVTGGVLESPQALPEDVARRITGPSSEGTTIRGGTRQRVGPGDIVVIPPHTPHGFVELGTERVVYTLIRVDGHKLLELKDGSH